MKESTTETLRFITPEVMPASPRKPVIIKHSTCIGEKGAGQPGQIFRI